MPLLYVWGRVEPLSDEPPHLFLVLICKLLRDRIVVAEIDDVQRVDFTVSNLVSESDKGDWLVGVEIIPSF
ncbi:MAG: hypothetical protein DMG70_06290 [Acidobacteria bacterium]|nr:MAG: hypothetical protein DMG70_06290 [Acidobacteriota bacterium]